MIRIKHDVVPVLVPPAETIIIKNNQSYMAVSTGFMQAPQALKTPVMQEFISVITLYNTQANRTPHRVSRTIVDGSTTDNSVGVNSDVVRCPSTTPPSICFWRGSIVNIGQTNTPNFR